MRTRYAVGTVVTCLVLGFSVQLSYARDSVGSPSDRIPATLVLPQSDVKEPLSAMDAARVPQPVDPADGVAGTNSTQAVLGEVEPNDSPATATPLPGSNLVVKANIYLVGEVDYFSFTASAGDKVFAATQTYFSATGASQDTTLAVIGTNGITELEKDDDNGALSGLASSIAATTIPATGTYYLRVTGFNSQRPITPYHLHFRLQSGNPTAESEPNNTTAQANPLPANGFVSGTVSGVGDDDVFSIALNAGDTVFLGLDLDPERDNFQCNGRLGFGEFAGQFLIVDDDGITDSIPSEAMFLTVKNAGTYYVYVDGPGAGCGASTATYRLSVSVHAPVAGCTEYVSTDVPKAIPDGGNVTSNLTVPAGVRASDVTVNLSIDHQDPRDLDVNLQSPAGNDNGLFVDTGDPAYPNVDVSIGDEAGFPIASRDTNLNPVVTSAVMDGVVFQPGNDYRMWWFDGEDAAGTWTLSLSDDTATNTGNLTAWSLNVCPTAAAPSCAAGTIQRVLYTEDFEASNGLYTSSGTADEWEWGTPTFAPVDGCNGGTGCWATDLDGTYDLSSSQDLWSPEICLEGVTGPIMLAWAQRFQMEGASFDHAWVEIVDTVDPANRLKVWEFTDGTMHTTQGTTLVQESAGWGEMTADITAFVNRHVQLRFHVDSDNVQNFAGLAIDDVSVTVCQALVNYVSGAGLGQPNPNEVVVHDATGVPTGVDFFAYAAGQWGTVVAGGEINGGTEAEIITGPGPGDIYGPQVRAFDRAGLPIQKVNFYAYGTLRFGVNSGAARLDNDAFDEILTGAGLGVVFGPHVRGWNFDGAALTSMSKLSFYAYSTLRYGVNITAGSVDSDFYEEIVTGAGPGTIFGPHVRGWNFDGGPLTTIGGVNFFALPVIRYGANVAAGDVDADCYAEILFTPGPGGSAGYGGQFLGFNYDETSVTVIPGYDVTPFTSLYGGRVGAGDVTGDGSEDLIVGHGRDPNLNSTVRPFSWNGTTLTPLPPGQFQPFNTISYGVTVASSALGY